MFFFLCMLLKDQRQIPATKMKFSEIVILRVNLFQDESVSLCLKRKQVFNIAEDFVEIFVSFFCKQKTSNKDLIYLYTYIIISPNILSLHFISPCIASLY